MLQQPLCDSSGSAVLSKHRAKGLAKIVKFEIIQAKILTYLAPSVLIETADQYRSNLDRKLLDDR